MPQANYGAAGAVDLADGSWTIIDGPGLDEHLGPYRFRLTGDDAVYAMIPDARHLNQLGIVHGGALIALLDSTLGLEAKRLHGGAAMVTIQLDCSLIGAVRAGELLCARASVVNSTRSLAFMKGDLRVDDRIVASATGIWKRINPATIGQGS
jgi:uncharacterized protein (TIGR00369 family)